MCFYINAESSSEYSFRDFFSKCDQIHRKLRVWSHLLKKSSMENFIFCAVPQTSDTINEVFHYGFLSRKLRIWSHLLKKCVMETSYFVQCVFKVSNHKTFQPKCLITSKNFITNNYYHYKFEKLNVARCFVCLDFRLELDLVFSKLWNGVRNPCKVVRNNWIFLK